MSRVTFTAPPPGLGSVTDFDLSSIEGATGLYTLQAASQPEVGMYLISAEYVPGYAPSIPEENLSELGLDAGGGRVLLVTRSEETITVNLMAPIVVNEESGMAAQIILDGAGYPVRAELAAV